MNDLVSNSSKDDSNADQASSLSYHDSASLANASQTVALREKEAMATDTAHEQQTPGASLTQNVSAKSDEPEKTGAKRKAMRQHTPPLEKKLRNYDPWPINESLRQWEVEEARRAALSPEARKEEDIKAARSYLQDHMEPQFVIDIMAGIPVGLHHYPRFILQSAPASNNGATCRFDYCTDRILPGQYRIALSPGMSDPRGPDFYHVGCFENLLDMSSSHYVARFDADRRRYIPDLGAQLIFEEYISRWKLRLSKAQDHENTTSSPVEKEGSDDKSPSNKLQSHPSTYQEEVSTLLGSLVENTQELEEATSENEKWVIADEMYEEMREAELGYTRQALNRLRSRWENIDGESSDWDILEYLLPETDPEYSERHALSQALELWEQHVLIATTEESKLTEAGRQMRADLPIKKIKRYLGVYVPAQGNIYCS